MTKKKRKISFRTVMAILTVFLVAFVLWQNWDELKTAFANLFDEGSVVNVPVLLFLIPEQLFMYYACGQVFFSYLEHRRGVHKFRNREIMRISTELNFVSKAMPAGGVGALAYLTFRLRPYQVSAGQTSFLYIFRYAVTTTINYLQALVAIVVLLLMGRVQPAAQWLIAVALVMNIGVVVALAFIIYMTSSRKRIGFFATLLTNVANKVVRVVTFGHKQEIVSHERMERYFNDIHESMKQVKENREHLKKPALWGVVYSLCEIGAYWITAFSLANLLNGPGDLPFIMMCIMVGEAIGSVFEGIVPFGLAEVGMAGVMSQLGVDPAIALIVTVVTRAIMLLFTIASGAGPYYATLRGNGIKEPAEEMEESE